VTAALGEVTPCAPAIALSPFGVIVAIVLLFTRPRAAAGAFLAGRAVLGDLASRLGIGQVAGRGHRPTCRAAYSGELCGSSPEADTVTASGGTSAGLVIVPTGDTITVVLASGRARSTTGHRG
jgi:hypothetical protein